jgi:16S rRNA (adenine1518-N6/adenine1519-N6)-dimethyltransferase
LKNRSPKISDTPRQKKHLGQVFLKERWPAEQMVELVKNFDADVVLEIGPGDGVLTQELLNAGLNVHAVEKDERFAERLRERWPEQGNFVLTEGDVLDFDLASFCADQQGRKIAVVGNIPYNISSPILKWLLPHLQLLTGVGLMTQLEFAERLASRPDTKAYGSLTVFTQLRAKVEMICNVPKTVFKPVPKVDSAIFTLQHEPSTYTVTQLRRIETITKAAFSQRRKKLRNGIKPWLNKIADQDSVSIDIERRPGTLSVPEFVQLAKEIFKEDF